MWDFTAYTDLFLMDYATLKAALVDPLKLVSTAAWVFSLDYTSLRIDEIPAALEELGEIRESYCIPYEKTLSLPAEEVLSSYALREQELRTMLWGLNVPILMMLAFYLFMVAQLVVRSDASELSMLTSRGGGRAQIMAAYLLQSLILCGAAFGLGPWVGWFFCKIVGAATGFWDFSSRTALPILLRPRTFVYAAVAFLFSLFMMLLPAYRASQVTIVAARQNQGRRWKAPLWQKLFLDILCLAVSLYGLYSYALRQETVLATASDGIRIPIDPYLFLISTLFLLGSGLLFLRLYPTLVNLVFHLGRRFWRAPAYSAFLTVVRSGGQEMFLMLFLILTVAIGVYSGNTARTLNANMVSRVLYSMPAEAVMQVKWLRPTEGAADSGGGSGYVEADFSKVTDLAGVTAAARVYLLDQMVSRIQSDTVSTVGQQIKGSIMVMEPEEFSRVVRCEAGYLSHSIYDYLQLMLDYPMGIVVSSSYRDDYGLKTGDTLNYYVKDDDGVNWGTVNGIILAFTDYWPGINPMTEKGEYFIVSNYTYWKMQTILMPYEYWLSLEDGIKAFDLYQAAEDNPYTTITSLETYGQDLSFAQSDALLQGANGALTMGFLMTALITLIGILLYWLMSVQARELQFGILRAMGLTQGQIMQLLLWEQGLLCLSALLAGLCIGGVAGSLYIPMLQMVSSAKDQCPPFHVFRSRQDYLRLYAMMALLIASGLALLTVLLRRLKITQALKLGED